MSEPLTPEAARKLIREILVDGSVAWSRHALDEMANDTFGEITRVDVVNVLRGGVVEPPEFERGSWRYRVRTVKLWAVVAFRSAVELVVVTAWRVNR